MSGLLAVDSAGPVVGVVAFGGPGTSGTGDVRLLETARVTAGADRFLSAALERALLVLAPGSFRLAVVVGPGAFTGVRVGIAHALGLAVARGLPVIPLSSLALRAAAAPGHASLLAVLDAKKGRVYAQRFDTRGAVPLPLEAPADVSPQGLEAPAGTMATGEGATVYAELLAAKGVGVVPGATESPLRAAWGLAGDGTGVDAAAVTPVYLREPDAKPLATLVQS